MNELSMKTTWSNVRECGLGNARNAPRLAGHTQDGRLSRPQRSSRHPVRADSIEFRSQSLDCDALAGLLDLAANTVPC